MKTCNPLPNLKLKPQTAVITELDLQLQNLCLVSGIKSIIELLINTQVYLFKEMDVVNLSDLKTMEEWTNKKQKTKNNVLQEISYLSLLYRK